MSTRDAVCSVCQRAIHAGAQSVRGQWLMRRHPPLGVFINVKQPDWPEHFIPTSHGQCEGTNTEPETMNIR